MPERKADPVHMKTHKKIHMCMHMCIISVRNRDLSGAGQMAEPEDWAELEGEAAE